MGILDPHQHDFTDERALAIDSPAYDAGLTEEEVCTQWTRYWESLRQGRSGTSTGE